MCLGRSDAENARVSFKTTNLVGQTIKSTPAARNL